MRERVSNATLKTIVDHIDTKTDDADQIIMTMIRVLKKTVENHNWMPDENVINILHAKLVESDSFHLSCELCACLSSVVKTGVKVRKYIQINYFIKLSSEGRRLCH